MTTPVRCLFSISTGRSGSHYLSRLLEHVSGCRSFHQRQPYGNGQAMRRFLRGDRAEMEPVMEAKLADIEAANADGLVYAETNHCFIKGFGWLLAERLDPAAIGVVILDRPADEIVDSTLKIRSSPLSRIGRDWTITPEAVDPLVPAPHRVLPPRGHVPGLHCGRRAVSSHGPPEPGTGPGPTPRSTGLDRALRTGRAGVVRGRDPGPLRRFSGRLPRHPLATPPTFTG